MNENIENKDKYYRVLLRTVVFVILVTAITPMAVVTLFILEEFKMSYHKKLYDNLELLARKHKKNIDMFLKEKLMDINLMANSNGFEELSNEVKLNKIFNVIQRSYDRVFVDLGIVNHEGVQIAYAGPHKLKGAKYSETEWFKKAIISQYFISDVFSGLRGTPHFIVTVRNEHDGKPWILRATIDFGEFNNLVEYLRLGETGFAFIINQKGQFQTKPISEVNPEKFIKIIQDKSKSTNFSTILEQYDNSDNIVLYTLTSLKNGEWIMVLQQDHDDAFADLENTQKIAFLITLVGSLVIIATALILSHMLINRISKADEEKKIADDEKEKMSKQVIETGKLASIGKLAAGIAHEINNPVAIMVEEAGWIKDLLEEEEFQESNSLNEINRALDQINTQGKRCKDITHKLLSFARKTDSRVEDIFVNELLTEIVHLFSQRSKYSNIEVTTRFQKNLPPLSASETELQQVFLNLVNNSLDAMEKTGGTVTLSSNKFGNDIVITVADTGPGINEANLSHIFDPFFTTKPVGKGTGLGLSICYGIIKKMGGDINVQSAVNKGTIFEIKIPINKDEIKPSNNGEE